MPVFLEVMERSNIEWVSRATMMTLAFTNMRNCHGSLANKGCDLTCILKELLCLLRGQ